jgi:hypothetical protein
MIFKKMFSSPFMSSKVSKMFFQIDNMKRPWSSFFTNQKLCHEITPFNLLCVWVEFQKWDP